MSDFNQFSFDKNLMKTLGEIGYEKPTAIQSLAIPKVMEGVDIIASAQTGTGKTGAFLLPAIQMITRSPRQRSPQVLILAPTRELAMQIAAEAEKFSRNLQLKTVCIFGGVPYPAQRRSLSKPYDILVATPGRLLDHMDRGIINLSKIKILVLDEADRMLDMGFIEPVEAIAKACPANRQTLLFSATIDKKIQRVSDELQKDPFEIKIEPDHSTQDNIEQRLYYTDNMEHKLAILDHLLEKGEMEQAIIFIGTKRQADETADALCEKGHSAEALHGDMNQRQRTRTVEKLRRGHVQFVIATDVAARGIDIPELSHVINIDMPFKAEDYIHRIGRTGRAGAKGVAITFASYKESHMLTKINKLLPKPIEVHTIEGLEPKFKPRSEKKFPPRRGNGGFRNKGRGFKSYSKRGERSSGDGAGFGGKDSFSPENRFKDSPNRPFKPNSENSFKKHLKRKRPHYPRPK